MLPVLYRAAAPPANFGSGWTPNVPLQSARGPSAPSLTFSIVGSPADLLALKPEWDALFDRVASPGHVFQTHAFSALWASIYLAHDADRNPTQRLSIVVARRNGHLALVWPLVMSHALGLRTVSWLGEPAAQYGDVLIEPSADTLALLMASWSFIQTTLAPSVVRLHKVRADAQVAPFMAQIGAAETARCEAPSVALGRGPDAGDLADFEHRQTAKARKNRRRLLRRLEELGRVEFVHRTGCDEARALIEAGLGMKREWLRQRGLVSRAFADHRIDTLLATAGSASGVGTGCTAFAICLDGRPIAVAVGFACKGRMSLHMIAHALEHEKAGVGVLNLEAVLRTCQTLGFSAVDLLAPKADYKMDWADSTVPVVDFVVSTSLTGRLQAAVLSGVLVPGAKRIVHRLPIVVRRLLAGRFVQL